MNANPTHVRPASGSRRRSASSSGRVARRSLASVRHQDDIPHSPGSASCLCPSCHLKLFFFPRRQDGRIVLPHPLLTRSVGAPGSVPSASMSHGVHGEREGPTPDYPQDDRGEGTSTGMGWLAGPGVPTRAMDSLTQHHPVLPEFEGPSVHDHERTTPQRPPRTKRPSRTDRSRPSRTSKPYDSKPSMTLDFQGWVPGINNNSDRPEPWPRIATMDPHEPSYPAQNLPTAYEEVTSHQSTASLGSERRRSWPDPYEDIGAERFSQFIQPPIQFGTREANLSTTSTLSRTLSHAQSSGARTPSVPPQPLNASRPSSSHSSQHRHPSLPSNESTNTSYLTDPTGFEGPPTVLRFSSRSRNPQPELWGSSNQPTEATNPYNTIEPMGHFEGEISQAGPSQQQISTGRLRFQNPVTPQIHVANAARPKSRARATSVVHVKWDTERKRRQGYFAQEDGAEKSPFRHYNKTGCDFDS